MTPNTERPAVQVKGPAAAWTLAAGLLLLALASGAAFIVLRQRGKPVLAAPEAAVLTMTATRQEGSLEFYAGEAGKAYMRGIEHQNKKEHEAAIADFSEAIRLDAKRAEVYASRAMAYDILGRSAESLADYDQAILLKSDDPSYLLFRGLLLNNMGKPAEAQADCQRLKGLDPNAAASLCGSVERR